MEEELTADPVEATASPGGAGARESSKVRRRPKVGGELEGDAAGLPEGRGSVGRKRGSGRSFLGRR